MTYKDFIRSKSQIGERNGFKPVFMPDFLFDFQKALVEWNVEKGRGAILANCGLGKSPIALTVAENIVRKTNKPVLILTPLSVAAQFEREGEKFGIECEHSRDGKFKKKIVAANYERLHYFNPHDFGGIICDEASCLKNYKGAIKSATTEFARHIQYRSLCTATPSPNDYIELGTLSECLGEMGYIDMLKTFFKADNDSYAQGGGPGRGRYDKNPFGGKFRFRGHAEMNFWRWVCSWARAIRKPSDLGFSDRDFILPKLTTRQHTISANVKLEGYLIDVAASGLKEQREERRRTLEQRCEKAAECVIQNGGPSISWCSLNDEGDLLEKLIPDCVQVSGSDLLELKEEKLEAFRTGQVDNLISKGEICGFGNNYQHCAHQTCFANHSFEQFYQQIRRSWRFGQKREVIIDIVTSEGESRILSNMQRKSMAAEKMFANLVEMIGNELKIEKENVYTKKVKSLVW